MALADRRDRRLGQGGLGASRVGRRGLHIPGRQAADEPGDHQRLQRVALGDAGAEQARRKRLRGAAQLRPGHRHPPGGGLDRRIAVAVAATRPRILALGGALVTGAAEELAHLGLHRGLDDQLGTQPGDVLDDLDQPTRAVEQGVDLGTDPLGRGYSLGHGRSPSFVG
jgi:hypothetical protein